MSSPSWSPRSRAGTRTWARTAGSCRTSPGSSSSPSVARTVALESGARRIPPYNPNRMIYCVIPRELEGELFERMTEYYKDNPNVTVIVDRRDGPDRRDGRSYGGQRTLRDRRRQRVPGTFSDTAAPD